jgi:hypothetical protein
MPKIRVLPIARKLIIDKIHAKWVEEWKAAVLSHCVGERTCSLKVVP